MHTDGTRVPEVSFREDQVTGSGAGGNMLTPISMIEDTFPVVPNEQVGQLYAYRINDSAVVLGTRRASTFGASIGIGAVASGTYRCIAENDNAESESDVIISVASRLCQLILYLLLASSIVFFHRSICSRLCLHEGLCRSFQHHSETSKSGFIHVCCTYLQNGLD